MPLLYALPFPRKPKKNTRITFSRKIQADAMAAPTQTVYISSVMGELGQHFGAEASATQWAKITAHNENFWGMMKWTEISVHNNLMVSRINTFHIWLPMQQHRKQIHVVSSRPVPAADHFVTAVVESWPINRTHRYTWCCIFQNSMRWGQNEK